MRVGVILSSVREKRRGEAFARWILELARKRSDVVAELIDLKEWPIPAYEVGLGPTLAEKGYAEGTLSRRFADLIHGTDAFIIVTPEYNHAYPGNLKNALDHLYPAWTYKAVAFTSYGGFSGGARAVEQLRLVALELRMVPVRDEVNLRLINLAVDGEGRPSEEIYTKRADAMIDELLWMARVLRDGRAQNPHA